MDYKMSVLLLLLLCTSFFLEDQILAISKESSNEELLELENQVKLLNKRAIATIQTTYGEEFDCVDFYEQHAFDHPALKNHIFYPEMRPSSYHVIELHNHSTKVHQPLSDIWLNGKGCPTGSIPSKRITKYDLIRIRLAEKLYVETYDPATVGEHGTHYAVLRTKSGIKTEFYGAGMGTAIYNPHVTNAQYSSSQVKLTNDMNSIEAGWTVNPSLYNDDHTHLFIHTNAGAIRCFNTYCPGFVYTNKDIPLGLRLTPVSQSGGHIYGNKFLIYKDGGNWWLQFGEINHTIGFWPGSIFTSLKEYARSAEWGGKVYSPSNVPSPPMGAGAKKFRANTLYDAYCYNITTIDKFHKSVDAKDTFTYADIKQYQVEDLGIIRGAGHVIVFGGPSGYIGN